MLKAQNLEPLRRESLRTARDFYERFVQQHPDSPLLQAELAKAHWRLGLITSALESRPKALEHYQKMGAIFERLRQAHAENVHYQEQLAESYLLQGESLRTGTGSSTQAEAAFERSRQLLEELVRAYPEEPAYRHELARRLRRLGNLYLFLLNEHGRAQELLLAARQIYDSLPADFAGQPPVQFELSLVHSNLAKLYAHTDRPEQHRAAAVFGNRPL